MTSKVLDDQQLYALGQRRCGAPVGIWRGYMVIYWLYQLIEF